MKNNIPMFYGIITGVIVAMVSTISSLIGLDQVPVAAGALSILSYGVLFAGIYLAIKTQRDTHAEGYGSFGKCMGWGGQAVLFASLSIALFTMVYMQFDSKAKERIITETQKVIEEKEMDEETAQMTMKMTEIMSNPIVLTFSAFCVYGIIGLLFAALASALLKKDPHSFSS